MGRRRTVNFDLPPNVVRHRGKLYFRKTVAGGRKEWLPIGTFSTGPELRAFLRNLLVRSRSRAKVRRLEHELTLADVTAMWTRSAGRCEVSGLSFHVAAVRGRRGPYTPSIDRIDSADGYRWANCRPVCLAVNVAINEWGLETFAAICQSVVARRGANSHLFPVSVTSAIREVLTYAS